jgi:hypothetical protein
VGGQSRALREAETRQHTARKSPPRTPSGFTKGPFPISTITKRSCRACPLRKPLGAGFYPEDISKKQFEALGGTLSPEKRAEAEGFFTVIERGPGNTLKAVKYSDAYKKDLTECARLCSAKLPP